MHIRRMSVFARTLSVTTAVAAAFTGLLAASGALAQTTPEKTTPVKTTAAKTDDATVVIVTGSALRTSPDAVAVPVTTINAEAIAKAGVSTNVLDILRKEVPSFGGRSSTGNTNAANTNQNTAGGSSIQLRNLDTLVLVNGRRVAADAIAGVNGKVFVNVAEIPPGAIERIEVLTDGASAIYGSEAIGGVVNIILKSNYQGGQVSTRVGVAADGYNEKSIDATYGFNPFKGTNITISASTSSSSPLYQNQRSFSSPFYSTASTVPGAVGNYFLNSGITTPTSGAAATISADSQYSNAGATISTAPGTGVGGTYNLAPYQMLVLKQGQQAAAMTFTSDLTENRSVVAFGDLEFAKNNSFAQFAPVTATVSAPAGSPFNPLTVATNVVFGSTANPKTYTTAEQSERGTLGLRGHLDSIGSNWNWEVALTHSENTVDQTINNVIFSPNLGLAVAGGYNSAGAPTTGGMFSMVHSGFSPAGSLVLQPALNPFSVAAGVTPGALANVLTAETIHGTSKVDMADAKLTGSIGRLPAGKPSFAVGMAWRKEAIAGAPNSNAWAHVDGTLATAAQSLYTGGLGADPFSASRTIMSEYIEVRVPITSADWNIPGFYNFDLIGAERHEHYSDFGNSTVPKIGFRWQPIARQIIIRGSYANSFTAPSLYQLGGPLNISSAGGAVITNAFPTAIPGTSTQEGGSNPNLQPAKSESKSLGVVLKPDFIPNFKVDFEYSAIREKGQIAGIGLNNILADVNAHGSASQFYHNVATGAVPGDAGAVYFSNPGDVLAYVSNNANLTGGYYNNLYLKDVPTNLGLINVKSLNVNADYFVDTDTAGTFSFSTQAAFLLSFKYQAIPSQPVFEFAGTTTQGGGAQGTLPKLRSYSTFDWNIGKWDAGVGVTYVASVKDIGTGGNSYYTNLATNPVSFAAGHVASFTSLDLRLSYEMSGEDGALGGVTLTGGVTNLFDQMPPISSNINPAGGHASGATAWRSENYTDLSAYGSGIGRLIYISLTDRF